MKIKQKEGLPVTKSLSAFGFKSRLLSVSYLIFKEQKSFSKFRKAFGKLIYHKPNAAQISIQKTFLFLGLLRSVIGLKELFGFFPNLTLQFGLKGGNGGGCLLQHEFVRSARIYV